MNRLHNKSAGFTLIELLVVISIIALLASVVVSSVQAARESAQVTKTVMDLRNLERALFSFSLELGLGRWFI